MENIKIMSTNRKCERMWIWEVKTPLNPPLEFSSLINILGPSKTRRIRTRERGHPYLSRLSSWKKGRKLRSSEGGVRVDTIQYPSEKGVA